MSETKSSGIAIPSNSDDSAIKLQHKIKHDAFLNHSSREKSKTDFQTPTRIMSGTNTTPIDSQSNQVVTQLRKQIDSLKAEQSTFMQSKKDMEDRIESLLEEKMKYNKDAVIVRAELEIANVRIQTLERDLDQKQQLLLQERRRHEYNESTKSAFESKMSIVAEAENKFRSEISALELELTEKSRKYEGEISNLKSEIIASKHDKENAESDKDAAEDQLKTALSDVRRLQNQIASMKTESVGSSHFKGELEFKLTNFTNENKSLKQELQFAKDELLKLRSKFEKTEQTLKQRTIEYEKNMKSWESTRVTFETQILKLTESESLLREELRQTNEKVTETADQAKKFETETIRLQKDVTNLQKAEQEAKEQIVLESNEQVQRLQEEMKKLQINLRDEQANASELKRDLEGKLLALKDERAIGERETLSMKSDLESSRSKIDSLDKELLKKRQDMDQLQKQIEVEREGFEKGKGEFSQRENNYALEIRRLELSITELTEKLSASDAEATKLKQELSRLREAEADAKALLLQTSEQQLSSLQLELKKQQDLVREEQDKSAKRYQELEVERLNIQNEKLGLQRDLSALQSDMEVSRDRLRVSEKQLSDRLTEFEGEKARWEATRVDLGNQVAVARESATTLGKEVARLEKVVADLTSKLGELESQNKTLTATIASTNEALTVNSSERTAFEAKIEALYAENIAVQTTLAAVRSERDASTARVEALELEVAAKAGQQDLLRQQYDASKQDLESQIQTLNDSEVKLKNDARRLQLSYSDVSNRLVVSEALSEQLKADIASLRKTGAEARAKSQNDCDEQIQTLQADIRRLQAQVRDEAGRSSRVVSEAEDQVSTLQRERSLLLNDISKLKVEVETLRTSVEDFQQECSTRTTQLEQMKKTMELSTLDLEKQLREKIELESNIRSQVRVLEKKIEEQTTVIESVNIELSSTYKVISTLQEKVQAAAEEIKGLESQKDAMNKSVFQTSLTITSELDLYKKKVDIYEYELPLKDSQLEQLKKQIEIYKTDFDNHRSSFAETEGRLRADVRKAELQVTDLTYKNAGLEEDLGLCKQDLAVVRKLEAEARAQLQFMASEQLQATQSELKRLQNQLREEQLRMTLLRGEFEGQLDSLSAEKLLLQNSNTNLKSQMETLRETITKLEDELSIATQQMEQNKKTSETLKAEMDSSHAVMMETDTRLRSDLRRTEQLLAEAKMRSEVLESEIQNEKKAAARYRADYASSAQSTAEMESLIETMYGENITLQKNCLVWKAELETAKSRVEALEFEIALKLKQSDLQRKRYEASKLELEGIINTHSEAENICRSELRRSESQLAELKGKVSNYEEDIQNLRHELSAVRRSEPMLRLELQSANEEQMQVLFGEQKRLQTQLKEEQNKSVQIVAELESQIKSLQAERGTLQLDVLRLTSELESAENIRSGAEQDLISLAQRSEVQKKQWDSTKLQLEQEISRLAEADTKLRTDQRKSEVTISDYTKRLQYAEDELTAMEGTMREYKTTMLTQEDTIAELERRILSLSEENASNYKTIQSQRMQWEYSKNIAETNEQELSGKVQQLEILKKQWETSRNDLEAQILVLSESETFLQSELRRYEMLVSELTLQVRALEDEQVKLRLEFVSVKDRENTTISELNLSFEEQTRQLRNDLRRCQSLLREEQDKSSLLVSDLESQINLLVGEKNILREEVKDLRSDHETSVSTIQKLESDLEMKSQLYEKTNRQIEFMKSSFESQLQSVQDSESKALADCRNSEMAATELQRVVERLEFEVKSHTKTVTRLTEELSTSNGKLTEYERKIQLLQGDRAAAQKTILTMNAELDLCQSKFESLEQDFVQRQQEHERQRKQLEGSRQALENQVSLLNSSENDLKSEVRKSERKIAELNQKISDLEQSYGSKLGASKKAEAEATSALRAANETLRNHQQVQVEVKQCQARVEQLKVELKASVQARDEAVAQMQALSSKHNSAVVEANSLKAELELCRNRAESQEKDFNQRVQHLEQQKRTLEQAKSSLEAHISVISESEARLRTELRRQSVKADMGSPPGRDWAITRETRT